ncbi:MAG: AzlC family ABC transporter permease [Nocardioides sp.]
MGGHWVRRIRDELGQELLRDITLVCLAVGVVGASYGAITVSEGLPTWTPSYMSVVVFAGASQFLFTGVVAAGGSPVAAVVAGLLVNARHLPFGFALADTVKDHRLFGSYLMIDEVVAFALAQRDPHRRRVAFFTCGVMLWVCWNIGSLLGALAGTAITDTDAFGLDAAFPAVLVALVLPGLRDRTTRAPALLGAVIALALTPFLPSGLPVLFSLFGLVLARPGRHFEEVAA